MVTSCSFFTQKPALVWTAVRTCPRGRTAQSLQSGPRSGLSLLHQSPQGRTAWVGDSDARAAEALVVIPHLVLSTEQMTDKCWFTKGKDCSLSLVDFCMHSKTYCCPHHKVFWVFLFLFFVLFYFVFECFLGLSILLALKMLQCHV